jgi:hypothetical protein
VSCHTSNPFHSMTEPLHKITRVLRRVWNLASRKFDTILRIKCFQFPGDSSRKQLFDFRAKYAGDNEQLQVRNASFLIFKIRHRFPTCVPSKQLKLERQARLRPPLFFAQLAHLRTHDIEYFNTFFDVRKLTILRNLSVSFTIHSNFAFLLDAALSLWDEGGSFQQARDF